MESRTCIFWKEQYGAAHIMLGAICLALFAVIPYAHGQGTDLVTNGSFEANTLPAYPGYTGNITGWTLGGGDILNNASGPFYSAGLGSIPQGSFVYGHQDSGSISQVISGLNHGANCTLRFYRNLRAGNTGMNLTAAIGTHTLYGPALINTTASFQYHQISFTYDSAWGQTLRFTFTNPGGDQTILLDHVQLLVSYTVTPSVSGGNGTIAPNTAQTVNAGGNAAFTMTPNAGYRVGQILVDGARIDDPVLSYNFTNVYANHTIAVSFATPDWTFNTAGYREGWAVANQIASWAVAGGLLSYDITTTATDPMWNSQQMALPRANYRWLRVIAKNETKCTGSILFWDDDTIGGFTGGYQHNYAINPHDTQLSEYWVDLNAKAQWMAATTIEQFRFDFPDSAPTSPLGDDGTHVDVDRITLLPDGSGPPAPQATSITRYDPATAPPNYTNAAQVTWEVRFNHSMSTVAANDFAFTATGSALGAVANVTRIGPTWYQVTANVSGTGTLRLNCVAGGSGRDVANQAISTGYTSGEIYNIDREGPALAIGAPSATLTRSGPVTYTATYSDAGSGFNASTLVAGNITLNTTGTATGTIGISGSGNTRTVTISSITGTGTLGISIAAGTATDVLGNTSLAAGPSAPFAVDNTPPQVTNIAVSPSLVNLANEPAAVVFTVTFSEPVNGFDALSDMVAQVSTGSITFTAGSVVIGGSGTTRTVTLPNVSGNGTLAYSVSLAANNVEDAAGNDLASSTTSPVLTVDTTAPTISFDAISGDYQLNATEDDSGLTISGTTTAEDGQVITITIGSNSPTDTVSGGVWSVFLTPAQAQALPEGAHLVTANVDDVNGNPAPQTVNIIVVDRTAPTVTCPGSLSVNVDPGTCTNAVPDVVSTLTATEVNDNITSDGSLLLTLAQAPTAGTSPVSDGQLITITLSDEAGNEGSCNVTLSVVDNEDPTLSNPGTQNLGLSLGTCSTAMPDLTGLVGAADNCAIDTVVQSVLAGASLAAGSTTSVTVTATDATGNSAGVTFDVIVAPDSEDPVLVNPGTQNLSLAPGACTVAMPDYTGAVGAADNCGVDTVTQTVPVGTLLAADSTTSVTVTVTDAAGNSSGETFDVIVAPDTEAPTLSDPGPQNLSLAAGECSVDMPDVTALVGAADNCGVDSITQDVVVGTALAAGSTTTVTVTVTDAVGNSDSVAFDMVVAPDTEDPVVVANGGAAQNVPIDAVFTDPGATATDNCGVVGGGVIAAGTCASGDCSFDTSIPANTWTIEYSATDVNGNGPVTASTVFTVVSDVTPPAFDGLLATPAEASAGVTVTLTFTVSETLMDVPEVLLNGSAATLVSQTGLNYTFEYVVTETDDLGPVTISIAGEDLAGNIGVFSSSDYLTFTDKETGLPIGAAPLALLLALSGAAVLRRRRH